MADSLFGLSDLVTINDKNLADLDVTDLIQDAPLLAALAAAPASDGTLHKYLKETGAPVVGFRAVNAGRDLQHSTDTLVTVTLKLLDASFRVDKGLAMSYIRGGAQALVAREGKRHLKSAFAGAELQLINGVGADSGGFVGLTGAATIDGLADGMVFNAGGSAAESGPSGLTSVYLLRSNDDGNDVTVIGGSNGSGDAEIVIGDTIEQEVVDGSGKHYTALCTSQLAWLALQIGSAYSVGRIANLSTASTHTLTDTMVYAALALFPAARQPTHIVMNRRSLEQLRASRTATNMTGAPAPRPTDVDGIPIVVTEGVLNSETAVA